MIKEIKGGHLSISKNDNAFFCIYFQRTPDGSIYINDTNAYDETRDISSLVSVADRLSRTIDQMFEMTRKFNDYTNATRDMLTSIKNSASTSSWKSYGDSKTYNNY